MKFKALLQCSGGDVRTVYIHDALGRLVREVAVAPGVTRVVLEALGESGGYWVTAGEVLK